MNRYPLWKYVLILTVVLVGAFYALPNIYGQDPVVQVTASGSQSIDDALVSRVESVLAGAGIEHRGVILEPDTLYVKFADTEEQIKANDALSDVLKNYTPALNLRPNIPEWLANLGGSAMNLGLDLRGGVYFLLEVDMDEAEQTKRRQIRNDITDLLRKEKIPKKSNRWDGNRLQITFNSEELADRAYEAIRLSFNELTFSTNELSDGEYAVEGELSETAINDIKQKALEQNLTTLRNRVNEIGVAEPVIQRQGLSRIVVQLPGVQDPTKAKEILDTTATLEYRAVDMQGDIGEALRSGRTPVGSSLFYDRDGNGVLLKNRVIVTGDQLIDAQSGFDQESGTPNVSVRLNSVGASRMLDFTRQNVRNNMAAVLKERIPNGKDAEGKTIYITKEEVINNAVIQGVFSNQFQTTGLGSPKEAARLAVLLRAGALAAPVEIVEERTIGPSLGRDNIEKGVLSVQIGLALVLLFMLVYYKLFGLIANIALSVNLVLIVAFLSIFGATLTLPGIAGIVLTVGMAVDANVLIFERIKEELRSGTSVQNSIKAGYEKALSTIADANVTTLIAAVVLFAFGTGPIKGFAVTLSIGILTSMFTAIMLSRAIVNLVYGKKKRLQSLSI